MRFSVEALEGCVRRLSIELDGAEVDRFYIKTYSDFAFRYSIADIEDGRATPADIDAAFGRGAVVGVVANAIHTNAYPKALDALDLIALGSPSYESEQAPMPGQPYRFTARVEVSPIPQLSSYEPVCIHIPAETLAQASPEEAALLRETSAMEELAKRVEGAVPEVLCDAEEESIIQAVYAQANKADVPFTDFLEQQGLTLEAFNQDVMYRAQLSVRSDLALDSWAEHAGLQVSEQRLAEEFTRQNFPSPAFEMAEWQASGRLPQLRQAIRRRMALDDILTTLNVKETE